MIQSIRLQNFKGIRDVEVGLERLTVFVGPNGSGKTTLIQGLDLLTNRLGREVLLPLRDDRLISDHFSQKLLCDGTKLGCVAGDEAYQVIVDEVSERSTWQVRGRFELESCWREPDAHERQNFSPNYCQLFRFDPNDMGKDCAVATVSRLSSSGQGLTATLYHLSATQPANWEQLHHRLNQFIPTAKSLDFETEQRLLPQDSYDMALDETTEKRKVAAFLQLANGRRLPLHTASEGTLLILGLLAVLFNELKPHLVIVEDLDRGLHPLAQRGVIDLLREVLDQNPDLQIVATTHSPYLVDRLRPEEVRLTALREDGSVACGRLDEHPDYLKWKDEFFPGELWSFFGEKWVANLTSGVTH